MTDTQRFYVSTSSYVGPRPDEQEDSEVVRISTTPCRHASNGTVVVDGYCGAYGEHSTTAHGSYDTIEAARHYVENDLLDGDWRSIPDQDEGADYCVDPSIVAVYMPGAVPTMTREQSLNALGDLSDAGVVASSTDEEIAEAAERWNAEMVQMIGSRLDLAAVREAAMEYRDELVREAAHEDEGEDGDFEEDGDDDEQIELTARVGDVELYGTHSMRPDRMHDQDLLDAIADLMDDIPAGQPGQIVQILDARGKNRGTLTYGEDGWEYENPA